MEYRDNNYFNSKDMYHFVTSFSSFCSNVYYDNGNWWTSSKGFPTYKATSLPCNLIARHGYK